MGFLVSEVPSNAKYIKTLAEPGKFIGNLMICDKVKQKRARPLKLLVRFIAIGNFLCDCVIEKCDEIRKFHAKRLCASNKSSDVKN